MFWSTSGLYLEKNPSLEQSLLAQILDKFLVLAQISPWFWRVFSSWWPFSAQGSAELVQQTHMYVLCKALEDF